MIDISVDIFKTKQVLLKLNNPKNNVDKIYYSSNEHLDTIFSNLDFSSKKVLSVLGSGDQAFSFYNAGCESVDLFDKNKLTIYYFYLRMWTIKYLNLKYPPFNLSSLFISKLLDMVEVDSPDEKRAFEYWSQFVNFFNINDIKDLMWGTLLPLKNDYFEIDKIKNGINNNSFNFYNIDISKNVDLDCKYDVIYTSNIPNYICPHPLSIKIYRDNLYRLLNDGGMVVSTLVGKYYTPDLEKSVFSSLFDFYEFPEVDGFFKDREIPGYYYVKK